jgi:hypothetical protein
MQVIERVQADKTGSSVIVHKALRLLKVHVPLFAPSSDTLRALDLFLSSLISQYNDNPAIRKVELSCMPTVYHTPSHIIDALECIALVTVDRLHKGIDSTSVPCFSVA